MNTWKKQEFQCSKNTVYGTEIIDSYQYTFVQTLRLYNMKTEL